MPKLRELVGRPDTPLSTPAKDHILDQLDLAEERFAAILDGTEPPGPDLSWGPCLLTPGGATRSSTRSIRASFADSDGDGIGDLPGITARLPYLARLGVDAVWLSPFYRSPQADAGYDVADYRAVDPLFGTWRRRRADRRRPRARAAVIVDLVPNHTSDRHAWFRAALAAGAGRPRAGPVPLPRRPGRTAPSHRTTGRPCSAAPPGRG